MAKIIRLKPGEGLSPQALQEVAQAARACRIVAFPTDTVYGLGSTGLIKAASRRIYEVKSRDSMKPLPILVHSTEEARRWVEWNPLAEALARRFWPGPLTLTLRPTKDGRLLTLPEFQTLAIRVPAHPVALSLIEASGVPWASTSANKSGSPALAEGAAVAETFKDLVDYIIDAGPAGGVESSLVDLSSQRPRVLREGALGRAQIFAALELLEGA